MSHNKKQQYFFLFLLAVLPLPLVGMKRSAEEMIGSDEETTSDTEDKREKVHDTAQPLIDAAKKGDVEEIQRLLQDGYYVDTHSDGMTPLLWAIRNRHKDAVELLIDSRASLDKVLCGYTPLFYAVQLGNREMVELLLQNGADVTVQNSEGQTALIIAAECGHDQIIEALLLAGAQSNVQDNLGVTPLIIACRNRHREAICMLLSYKVQVDISDNYNRTALIVAAYNGYYEIVKLLLDAGANVNAQDKGGATALNAASEKGHKELVVLLLARGADRKLTAQALNGVGGLTALMMAARNGHVETVKCLIDQDSINVQAKDGATALMRAAIKGHSQVVKALLEANAHVDLQDKNGATPLMRAITNCKMISLLLKYSARIDFRDRVGRTALDYAREHKASESLRLLSLCSLPEVAYCRSYPLESARQHRESCLNKKHYIRTCKVNRNNCLLLGRSVEPSDHRDCYHQTPLLWMAMFGYTQAVEELLKADIPLWFLNAQDKDGCTALMYAVIYGHYDIVHILTERYKKEQLPEKKRAITIRDSNSKSALTYAIQHDCTIELINTLLDAGCRPTVRDVQIASQRNRYDIILQCIIRKCIAPLQDDQAALK